MSGTRVTAVEIENPGKPESTDIVDNYVIIVDGSARIDGVVVHRRKDGTSTHVITVKGCR